jgi:uncharacterized protein
MLKEATMINENSTWNKLGDAEVGQTIIINLTERCNLNCVYCYEHGRRGRDITLGKAIPVLETMLEKYSGLDSIGINFCGGEPLLRFEDIQKIYLHIQKKYIETANWKSSVYFSMTTNGTLLTPEMAQWFENHPPFVFALSFDGTPESQNHNRSNSYDQVMNNLWFFKKNMRPMKMTIGPDSIAQCAQDIKHIHSLGLNAHATLCLKMYGAARMKFVNI